MTKRILAIGAALLLCLFCVCAWAEGENCRLTLTLAFGEQPVEGAEFSLYRVGEMQMSGGTDGGTDRNSRAPGNGKRERRRD